MCYDISTWPVASLEHEQLFKAFIVTNQALLIVTTPSGICDLEWANFILVDCGVIKIVRLCNIDIENVCVHEECLLCEFLGSYLKLLAAVWERLSA